MKQARGVRDVKACSATTDMLPEAGQLVTDLESLSVGGALDLTQLLLTCGSLMIQIKRRRSLASASLDSA